MFQSTPARVSGRYRGSSVLVERDIKFQSTPARVSGRYEIRQAGQLHERVSIHARSRERAIQGEMRVVAPYPEFQSTPARVSGRYPTLDADSVHACVFQSTPARVSGR